MLGPIAQEACPHGVEITIVTQEQLLSILGLGVLVGLFFISFAVSSLRRRRERARLAVASHGSAVAVARPGSVPYRVDVSPMSSDAPAGTPGFTVGDSTPINGSRTASYSRPLAGIDDAVTWKRVTDAEIVRMARYNHPATIVLVEVDGLNRLISALGPSAGERVIEATAATIRTEARSTDTVARLGPSRFGILMPETNEIVAINFTERVRDICDRWLQTGSIALRVAIGHSAMTSALGVVGAMQLSQENLDRERRSEHLEGEDVAAETAS